MVLNHLIAFLSWKELRLGKVDLHLLCKAKCEVICENA